LAKNIPLKISGAAEKRLLPDVGKENPTVRVHISRTNKEWEVLQKRMEEINRKSLSSYVMGRISIIERQYADNQTAVITSIEHRIQKPIFLKENSLKVIGVLSLKTGIPVATIIDRLILDPLILSK
jgi:hypothetical protein